MYNWTVDTRKMKKNKREYAIWKLEQMVNFGLNGGKLSRSDLKKFWGKLRLDPARRRFLRLLLHER